jgi:hypothetical protein
MIGLFGWADVGLLAMIGALALGWCLGAHVGDEWE